MEKINGGLSPEEQDAADLFPHTKQCVERMRTATLKHGRIAPCVCPAKAGRRNFLYLIRRTRRQAYVDAYAKIRAEAKARAERENIPAARQAYEEVAAWAEALEFAVLDEKLGPTS